MCVYTPDEYIDIQWYCCVAGGAFERGASGGSFIKIPPQVQLDIAARKKIIVDEHSGRILVDAELAQEQSNKMTKKLARVLSS